MGGVVLVEDECRVELEAKEGKIWAPKGVYPQLKVIQEHEGRCFYGASDIFSGEKIIHEAYWMDSRETVEFLKKVKARFQKRMKPKRKVLIIWDGAPYHFKEVKTFLKAEHDWLEIMRFPPYSPELNPEEQVWNDAKRAVTVNHEETDLEELVYKFYQFLVAYKISTKMCRKKLSF